MATMSSATLRVALVVAESGRALVLQGAAGRAVARHLHVDGGPGAEAAAVHRRLRAACEGLPLEVRQSHAPRPERLQRTRSQPAASSDREFRPSRTRQIAVGLPAALPAVSAPGRPFPPRSDRFCTSEDPTKPGSIGDPAPADRPPACLHGRPDRSRVRAERPSGGRDRLRLLCEQGLSSRILGVHRVRHTWAPGTDTNVVKEVSDPSGPGSLSFIFPCGKALFGDLAACGKSRAWTRRIELRVLHCMAWRWARDRGRGRRHRCG